MAASAAQALDANTFTMVKLFRGGPRIDVSVSGSTGPFLSGSSAIAARLAHGLIAAAPGSASGAIAVSGDAARVDAAIGGGRFSAAARAALALERDEAAARRSLHGLAAAGCAAVFHDAGARSLLPRLAVALTCSVGVAADNRVDTELAGIEADRSRTGPATALAALAALEGASGRRAERSAARLAALSPPAGRRAALAALIAARRAIARVLLRFEADARAGGTSARAVLTRDLAAVTAPAAADVAAASKLGIGNVGCG